MTNLTPDTSENAPNDALAETLPLAVDSPPTDSDTQAAPPAAEAEDKLVVPDEEVPIDPDPDGLDVRDDDEDDDLDDDEDVTGDDDDRDDFLSALDDED